MDKLIFGNLKRWLAVVLIWQATAIPTVASAQESETREANDSATANAETISQEKIRQELAAALSQIAESRETLQQLNMQRSQLEDVWQEVLDARVTRSLEQLISLSQATAKAFLEKQSELPSLTVDREQARLVEIIGSLTSLINAEIVYIREHSELPQREQTALAQAAVIAELEVSARAEDKLVGALIENIELAAALGSDTRSAQSDVERQIIRGALNASAYLDVTMDHLDKLRRQLATLPKNEELKTKVSVTERHVRVTADILRERARRMHSLGIDTSWIETQLVGATGALTTEILNWSVIKRLTSNILSSITSWISSHGPRIVFQILVFLGILAISWKLARLGTMVAKRALDSMRVRPSQLLQAMIVSTTRGVILISGLLIALSQLGVSIGPLLAGVGVVGFIVGFALQDSLSNFASGLMILIYRPFDVGDVVDVNGAFGKVHRMSLVNTTVLTFDNQTLFVPNNQVWRNVIKNLTGEETRRVDMVFRISYSDDVEKAERVLREILSADARILEQPEPIIKLHELGDSSVNLIVRPWVKTADYWDTYWDIIRAVKLRFDREGISIPFPQRDVHLYTQPQTGTAQ